MLALVKEVLHATEALHYFQVRCYISILESALRLKSIKRLEEGNDAVIITKKAIILT